MVTTEHAKVRTIGHKPRNYISYFQSVTTIGIINRAITAREAESAARLKLKNSDFMCGVVGQTPFELHATDEWEPNFIPEPTLHNREDECCLMDNDFGACKNYGSGPSTIGGSEESVITVESSNSKPSPLILNLDDHTKRCIADKFCKDPTTLTNSDYVKLIETLVEMGLE